MRRQVPAECQQFTGQTAGVPLEPPIAAEAEEMKEDTSRYRPGQPYLHLTP